MRQGLDPAGPLFETRDWTVGLNQYSADFVDIIHTNGEAFTGAHLGTMKVLGHVDFYPNGGGRQPGCILDPVETSAVHYRIFRRGFLQTELSGEYYMNLRLLLSM
jgi:Lipase